MKMLSWVRSRLRLLGHFVACLIALTLVACGGPSASYMGGRAQSDLFMGSRAGAPSAGSEVYDDVSYWDGLIPGGGSSSIVVNLTQQRAYFYQGSKLIGVGLVATGREGFGTPAGNYTIIEKLVEKSSNLYGTIYDADRNVVKYPADVRKDVVPPGGEFVGAEMPYWMRLTNGGIGMHEGPIPVPGSPASHGCIRVSKLVVQDFFNNAPLGTPVRIVY